MANPLGELAIRAASWRILGAAWKREAYTVVPRFCARPGTLVNGIFDALKATHGAPRGTSGLRVFIDGGQRYDLPDKIAASRKKSAETVDQWLKRVVGARYCVTFNSIGSWNEPLLRGVCKQIISPMHRFANLTAGADLYCFVGNYGRTPFGAHADPDHTFFLHLGPAKKTLLLWDADLFKRKTKSDEPLFDYAGVHPTRKVVLCAGDLALIPAGTHHVAVTHGFSISFGITVFPASLPQLAQSALDLELRRSRIAKHSGGARHIVSGLQRLGTTFVASAQRHARLLASNGFIVPPPRQLRSPQRDPLGLELQVPDGFKIGVGQSKRGRSELFVRGVPVTFQANLSLPKALATMNRGVRRRGSDLAKDLTPQWTSGTVCEFIKLMIELRGFDVL